MTPAIPPIRHGWLRPLLLGGVAVVLAMVVAVAVSRPSAPGGAALVGLGGGPPLTVARAVSGGAIPGFERATKPRTLIFPADHGPHTDYQTEWWYYTGNLEGPDGAAYGYQLTFFRQSFRAQPAERESAWGTSEAYLAHFGLTDVTGQRFEAVSKVARGGAIGLAGAHGDPFNIFVENWSARGQGDQVTLTASTDAMEVNLTLTAAKPPAVHGDRGLAIKGDRPGEASYYYSYTRMQTSGTVTIGGTTVPVTGTSWFDHEWGTAALGEGLVGWDWFALQLSDGRDLMWYQFTYADGKTDPDHNQGALITADGTRTALRDADVQLDVTNSWRSPHTGATYPARWRLQVPSAGIDLDIQPRLADQEHRDSLQYWEGTVSASGQSAGRSVDGVGYVELTGYADIGAEAPSTGPSAP